MSGNLNVMMAESLGVSPNYVGATAYRMHSGTGSATHLLFNSDGTVSSSGAGTNLDVGLPSNWYLPTTAAIGASYWVKAVYFAGDALTTDPSLGAWVSLTAGQDFARNCGNGQFKSNITTYSISSSAGGVPVLATGNCTLTGDGT